MVGWVYKYQYSSAQAAKIKIVSILEKYFQDIYIHELLIRKFHIYYFAKWVIEILYIFLTRGLPNINNIPFQENEKFQSLLHEVRKVKDIEEEESPGDS